MPTATSRPVATFRVAAAVLAAAALLAGCRESGTANPAQIATATQTATAQTTTARTATARTPTARTATTAPALTGTSPSPSSQAVRVFPVRSKAVHFGRFHHDYAATDIFAPCGSAALAPIDGRILEVSLKDTWSARHDDGAYRGGLSYSLEGVDGVRYYGSHLRSVTAVPGRLVRAGQVLGRVGHTGSAQPTACHLHFGISPACGTGDWWNRRGVISPYPYLTSWRKGGQRSPVTAIDGWRSVHGCPRSPSVDP